MPERAGSEAPIAGPETDRTLGHAFTIGLGIVGWFVVLAFPALGIMPADAPSGPVAVALFIIVILAARALAFRLVEGSVLSLDSAYYVAAALCVGTIEAGRLVALALTLDASARLALARRRGEASAHGPFSA